MQLTEWNTDSEINLSPLLMKSQPAISVNIVLAVQFLNVKKQSSLNRTLKCVLNPLQISMRIFRVQWTVNTVFFSNTTEVGEKS